MSPEIQIFPGEKEERFPIIKVTKSLNGKTGTATFFFLQPSCFQSLLFEKKPIEKIILLYANKTIFSQKVRIFFQEGKPFLLQGIFIFQTNQDWIEFFHFMTQYSKEKGLKFQEEELKETEKKL